MGLTVSVVAGLNPVVVRIETPPAEVAAMLAQLDDPNAVNRETAVRALSETDLAALYLRDQLRSARPAQQRQLTKILTRLDDQRHLRNAKRAVEWGKQRRADLLTDYAVTPADEKHAPGQIDPILRLAGAVAADYVKVSDSPIVYGGTICKHDNYAQLARRCYHHVGPLVRLPRHVGQELAYLVQSETLEIGFGHRFGWVCLVRDELRDTAPPYGGLWYNSLLLVNGTRQKVRHTEAESSLFVIDGDLDISPFAANADSIFIMNGTIRCPERPRLDRPCYFWATDGIEFPNGVNTYKAILHSGGRIDLGQGPGKPTPWGKENLAADPLGFRFFQLSDVGIEVTARPGGLTVTKVQPGSRFALYDVREGDVITKVNDTAIDSVKEFRRQVRQSVVAEYGVFYLRRGGESTNRIVSFRDVVLPK